MAALTGVLAALQSPAAQQPAPAIVLVLTVGDAASHDVLPDAEVRLSGTTITARTDRFGEARLSGVEPGSHRLDTRRLGYVPRSISFSAQVGDTLRLLLLLDRAVRSLDTIRVSAVARKAMLLWSR